MSAERRRPPVTAEPTNEPTGVYSLDLSLPDEMTDASGRIDWHKAISETEKEEKKRQTALQAATPRSMPPSGAAAPASSAADSAGSGATGSPGASNHDAPALDPQQAAWMSLPGASKLLRPRPNNAAATPNSVGGPIPGATPALPPAARLRPGTHSHAHPTAAGGNTHTGTPAPRSHAGGNSSPGSSATELTPSYGPVGAGRNPQRPGTSTTGAPQRPPTVGSADRMTRYEQLKRTPSIKMDPEAVRTTSEFSEITFHIHRALEKLEEFRKRYPYLIAPNILGNWEDNLKETNTTMLREFQALKDPRSKNYSRKYICKECKNVFFVSLGEDGICDECQGRKAGENAYAVLNRRKAQEREAAAARAAAAAADAAKTGAAEPGATLTPQPAEGDAATRDLSPAENKAALASAPAGADLATPDTGASGEPQSAGAPAAASLPPTAVTAPRSAMPSAPETPRIRPRAASTPTATGQTTTPAAPVPMPDREPTSKTVGTGEGEKKSHRGARERKTNPGDTATKTTRTAAPAPTAQAPAAAPPPAETDAKAPADPPTPVDPK